MLPQAFREGSQRGKSLGNQRGRGPWRAKVAVEIHDFLLWFVSGLVLPLWFDAVSVMILMWVKNCDFDVGQKFFFFSVLLCFNVLPHVIIISESYQNRIKTMPKSTQNHQSSGEIDQKPVSGLFLFPFFEPTLGSLEKLLRSRPKPYPNQIFRSYNSHIKSVKQNPEFRFLNGFCPIDSRPSMATSTAFRA